MQMRALTREEAKSITRRRLIDAAIRLAAEEGGRNLTASRVARAAGVAQPTFYVHFRDRDDLLETVAELEIGELRRQFQLARAGIDPVGLTTGASVDALIDAFRVPLETILSRPVQYRIYVQERLHNDSPLGKHCRMLADDVRADLVRDLTAVNAVSGNRRSEGELTMVADGLIALTEALGLGLIEKRYKNVDAALGVLIEFARGVLV